MYLSLLTFTYAIEASEIVTRWLMQADMDAVLISTERYDGEILAVLASEHAQTEAHRRLQSCAIISSCEAKRYAVYRVTTTGASEQVLHSFPLGGSQEWYPGDEQTAYLCMQSHHLNTEQISWLATCTQIAAWDCLFDLVPLLAGC